MGLLDVVRSGVKIADSLTKSLQASVTYRRCLSTDQYGKKQFGNAVTLLALVENKARRAVTANGIVEDHTITLTFLDVAALNAATGGVGVKVNDEIVLPDGSTNPVANIGGFVDAGTGLPFATEAYLG